MSLERMIIYLEAYAYDVCAWHRQVIALWVANEAISAGDENSSAWWIPRALNLGVARPSSTYMYVNVNVAARGIGDLCKSEDTSLRELNNQRHCF